MINMMLFLNLTYSLIADIKEKEIKLKSNQNTV